VGKAIGDRGCWRWIERAQFTPAASSAAAATHVMRTDANAPAKQACRFMGTLSRSTAGGFIQHCGKSSRIFRL
jgi:hypothetical protein